MTQPLEGLREAITRMYDEYMRDEECDYTVINSLIEASHEQMKALLGASGEELKETLLIIRAQQKEDLVRAAAVLTRTGKGINAPTPHPNEFQPFKDKP